MNTELAERAAAAGIRVPGFVPSGRGKRGADRAPRQRRGAERPPVPVAVVSERNLHSDRYMEKVPTIIGDLLHRYFEFEWMPFHVALLEEMFRGGTWVVNWPTDHAKSWMTSYFFPLLSLMENPDESHIICGASLSDSKSRIQMIQREIETNTALIADYPWIKKPGLDVKQAWSTNSLTVAGRTVNKRDPSVLASSVTASDLKGRRGKLIMDDIEGQDHRDSVVKRTRLYNWLKLEAIRNYEDLRESKRPLMLACGTPMDIDSIYFSLAHEDWQVDSRPIYLDPKPWASTDPADHKETLLWPDKLDKIRKQWRRLNADQFAIAYLMDPTGGNPNRLSFEEIKRLTTTAERPDPKDAQTFVSIDPASGSASRDADYCGISVVRILWPKDDKLPRVEVMETHRVDYPAGLIEHVHLAADLARTYGCRVIYEANAQQGGVYANAFMHHRPEVKLLRFNTNHHNKFDEEMGLTVLRRLVREGRLLVPQSQVETEGVQSLLREIRDLGSDRHHDHISASIWFVIRWIYNQVRTYSGPQVVNGWGAIPQMGPTDYIDREPVAAAASNGWGPTASVRQYRRFG